MRARMIFLIAPILLIAGFVALNWSEFVRPVPLSLGLGIIEAPLGMVMLGLLFLALLGFLIVAASLQTENLLAARHYSREITAQRDLADKAEASRFTELRLFLEAQGQDAVRREEALAAAVNAAVRQSREALELRIDQQGNSLAASLGELEDRLERQAPSNPVNVVV